MEDIKKFLEDNEIKYNDLNKYELPFQHSSYTNETPEDDESNERLEFLGDSILGSVVVDFLYRNFPDHNQGEMTLIKHYFVNTEYLSKLGKELEIQNILRLGNGIDKDELPDSIYEDVFESLIGAIYLDAGMAEVKKFIDKHITSKMIGIDVEETKDPKTRLQELMQTEKRKSVVYETDKFFNEEDKLFTSRAIFEGTEIGVGRGPSKKEAEKDAAKNALERMV